LALDLAQSADRSNETPSANPSADYIVVRLPERAELLLPDDERPDGEHEVVPCRQLHADGLHARHQGRHNIGLARVGSTVTVTLDGTQILSQTNAAFGATGRVGIGSYNGSVYFDNVRSQPPHPHPHRRRRRRRRRPQPRMSCSLTQ
jgi:hypothetical protein